MGYTLQTLWYERARFLPGVFAVSFSAILIALQCGLLIGLFSLTSLPVDHTRADLWVGSSDVENVDVGRPIPLSHMDRLAKYEGLGRPEVYVQGFSYWSKPSGGTGLCVIIGSALDDGTMGHMNELTPEMRGRLTEPGAVVIDENDTGRLGVQVGDTAMINGERGRVRVVGTVRGLKGLAGPYVFCSVNTARSLLRLTPEQTTYLLVKADSPATARRVADDLRTYNDMSAFTSDEFSLRSRWHWVTKTNVGVAMLYAAALGLLVGAVVTSQTLFAATVASAREYATLFALGIPRWRVAGAVLSQAAWVGVVGTLLAWPLVHVLGTGAARLGAPVTLPWQLIAATGAVTLVMSWGAGLAALRAVRQIEPVTLLR